MKDAPSSHLGCPRQSWGQGIYFREKWVKMCSLHWVPIHVEDGPKKDALPTSPEKEPITVAGDMRSSGPWIRNARPQLIGRTEASGDRRPLPAPQITHSEDAPCLGQSTSLCFLTM